MKFDLKVIKEGGYNAIRTWDEFSEPQLKLVQDSGLKLIMGIRVDPDQDYGDPQFVRNCEDSVRKVMSYSKKYDCIITYLILNEPQTDHMHKVSGKAFVNLMQGMMDIIHQEHTGRPGQHLSQYDDQRLSRRKHVRCVCLQLLRPHRSPNCDHGPEGLYPGVVMN